MKNVILALVLGCGLGCVVGCGGEAAPPEDAPPPLCSRLDLERSLTTSTCEGDDLVIDFPAGDQCIIDCRTACRLANDSWRYSGYCVAIVYGTIGGQICQCYDSQP